MGLKYVLNSMKRRKLRTAIIVIALTIGVALVGALLALVDTQRQFSIQSVGAETGGYDLSIGKSDLATTPFFSITQVEAIASAAYDEIATMHPRIQASVEARKTGATEGAEVTFIAIDPNTDDLVSLAESSSSSSGDIGIAGIRIGASGGGPGAGETPLSGGRPGGGPPGNPGQTGSSSAQNTSSSTGDQTVSGVYPPESGEIFLNSTAAGTLGAEVGDEVLLSYAIPTPREMGETAITGTSTPRITARFTVSGIGALSGLSSDVDNAVILRLDDAQAWLGASGQANQLLMVWQSSASSTTSERATVTKARDVGEQLRDVLQSQLGSDYVVSLPKYTRLESSSQSYTFTQTYITLYGILSMSIVGLMVNALMMTTVAEQKYDLAVLRVLGSPRRRLYEIVILEVAILGAIGIILGLLLGRAINDTLIVPIVLSNLDLPAGRLDAADGVDSDGHHRRGAGTGNHQPRTHRCRHKGHGRA